MKRVQGSKESSPKKPTKDKRILKQRKIRSKKSLKENVKPVQVEGNAKPDDNQKRGLLFITNLPLGFYEDDIQRYFLQFGKVTNVKVCRSQRTGRSRCCGYVEYSEPQDAKVAADIINAYSMIQARIKAQYVPFDERPHSLFVEDATQTRPVVSVPNPFIKPRNVREGNSKKCRPRKSTLKKCPKINNIHCLPVNVDKIKKEFIANSSEFQSNQINEQAVQPTQLIKPNTRQSVSNSETPENVEGSTSKTKTFGKSKLLKSNIRKKKRKQLKKGNRTTMVTKNLIKAIARELIRQRGKSLLCYPKPPLKMK